MNNISQYILEKLHIDKNTKFSNSQQYYCIIMTNTTNNAESILNDIEKTNNKVKVLKDISPCMPCNFAPLDEVKNIISTYSKDKMAKAMIGIWKIPQEYNFDEFKKDYMSDNGKIKFNFLNAIKYKDLFEYHE